MGSCSHHDPIAATMWGEITAMGRAEIRKAFQDLLTNKARLTDVCGAEGVGLCGSGCRAARGKAKFLIPQEMRGVTFLEFRRSFFLPK